MRRRKTDRLALEHRPNQDQTTMKKKQQQRQRPPGVPEDWIDFDASEELEKAGDALGGFVNYDDEGNVIPDEDPDAPEKPKTPAADD